MIIQYVWIHKFGEEKPKKISVKKLIDAVNHESFTKRLFLTKEEAKQSIKQEQ